jgi:hydroxylysine kinase
MTILTEYEAATAAQRLGLPGSATLLASERDLTFKLQTKTGDYVLKICHPDEDAQMIALQLNVLRHLKATAPALPVPHVAAAARLDFADGLARETYILSWLPGVPLYAHPGGPAQAFALGQIMARMAQSLASLPQPAKAPEQLWDISRALEIAPKLESAEPHHRALVEPVLAEFSTITKPGLARLPAQLIHNDFNPHNLFVDQNNPAHVTGVIDFGDITMAPRVNDLAVALSYRLPHDPLRATTPDWLAGYESISPLSDAERDLLPRLIRARMAMTITIASWRARRTPENAAYILRYRDGAERCLAAGEGFFNALFKRTNHV